jgi:predicted ribosome quality control (RQC) complex YloA/Tae2 family protein
MDWIAVFALGREAERLFKGCPLEAAYTLGENEYFFSFRRMKTGLFVSLGPEEPVLYACAKERDASEPSPAAMLARKHLERGKLKRVQVPPGERILLLDFDPGVLAVEMIPGKGNLAVVWDGFLMGSHAPLLRGGNAVRPGERYEMPLREGIKDIFKITKEEFEEAATEPRAAFPHLPAWFWEEAAARGGGWEAFAALAEELKGGKEGGFLYVPEGGARRKSDAVASPFRLVSRAGTREEAFDSFSGAVAARERMLRESGLAESPAARAIKRLRADEKRHLRALEKLRKEHTAAREAWRERRKGELILIALSNPDVKDGALRVDDIYGDPPAPVSIPIDPAKTLQENAARYFKRAKRLERALPQIEARLREVEAALAAARERIAAIEANPDSVREEDTGKPRAREEARESAPRRKPSLRGVRVFRSSDGYAIYVGKDSKANDRLTLRVARPHDLWLHASGYGGSHVVVANPRKGQPVPERTVEEAAALAAYFSQGRPNARLDIVVAERRHVRKRKGAPAGQVVLREFRTVRVEPKIGVEEGAPEG